MAIRILLNGCNGRMGRVFTQTAAKYPDIEITAGLDVAQPNAPGAVFAYPYPVYIVAAGDADSAIDKTKDADFDLIVDFSHPSGLGAVLALATNRNVPAVLATTGYTDAQTAEITAAAGKIPVFKTANMSIGINLMSELIRIAASTLADGFDIELLEAHHNQKLDAPSGTALMLADAMNEELGGGLEYVYDRHDVRAKRGKRELGIHAVRGGTIVGEHSVFFAGEDELIEIKHSAYSRNIFAEGAVRAARFMTEQGRASGLYAMRDVVRAKRGG